MAEISTSLLICGDTVRRPDLRHQVPLEILDPFLYAEHEGRRVVVVSALEAPRIEALGAYDLLLAEELGRDELLRELGSRQAAEVEVFRRGVGAIGLTEARVADDFPLALARALDADGVSLVVDPGHFASLRRVKTRAEMTGVLRAQRAAEGASEALRRLLAASSDVGGDVHIDGVPAAVDGLKTRVRHEVVALGANLDEFILSHGPQTAIGHDTGSGVLRVGEPIVLDLWPQDVATRCYSDMTRTFAVGTPDPRLTELHRVVSEAMALVIERVRPGMRAGDLHTTVCEHFEANGHRTPLSVAEGQVLEEGFPWPLGHGIGLDLHEAPRLRQGDDSQLLAGELLSIEPGLYVPGFGGCRIEDLILVTDGGVDVLTRFDHGLASG